MAAVLLNYDDEKIHGYGEVVAALTVLGSYPKNPIKINIVLKNRESPPAKPTIEEPIRLELKAPPSHLHYVFLGCENFAGDCCC